MYEFIRESLVLVHVLLVNPFRSVQSLQHQYMSVCMREYVYVSVYMHTATHPLKYIVDTKHTVFT